MGWYLPYLTCSRKEGKKIDAILNHGIVVDGLVIDIRRFSNDLRVDTNNIISKVLGSKHDAIILVDPRTDVFQVDRSTRLSMKSLHFIYSLAGLQRSDIENDSNFEPSSILKRLDKLIAAIYNILSKPLIKMVNGSTVMIEYFIPPYFVSHEYDDSWYRLTLESINRSIRLASDKKIIAPIAVDTDFLGNREYIDKLFSNYSKLNVYGFIILPYGVNELTAPQTVLENIVYLTTRLKNLGKFIIVATAEFGNVLVSLGVDALTFGICTRRTPHLPQIIEAGIAEIARVESQLYIPSVLRKLHANKVVKILDVIPSAYRCNCPICSRYSGSYLDLLEEADYTDFSVHYVYWKNTEIQKYKGDPSSLERDLENAIDIIKKYNSSVGEDFFFIEEQKYYYMINRSYLEKWLRVLRTFTQRRSENIK